MSTYTDASLIYYPSGYKAGTAYSLKPTDGSGDLDFTRASTATRVNESGLIESVAANVPRLDNFQGGCSSLLLEPQRTNLILNSEGVLANYNTKIGNLTDASTSINSFANSIQVGDNSVLSALYKSTQSWAAGPTYSFSFFVQMDDNSQPIIGLNATTGDFAIIVGGVLNNTTAKITRVNSTDTYLVSVSTTRNGGSASYGIIKYTTQSAKPFRITAMQNEIGSYPTSYIPTTTAVTRVAESASKTGISSLIGQTEGTLYWQGSTVDGVGTDLLQINSSNSLLSRVAVYIDTDKSLKLAIRSEGSLVINATSSVQASNTNFKIALIYKSGATKLYYNGTLILTSTTTFSLTDSMSVLELQPIGYTSKASLRTQSTMIFTTILSDAEAIALTTL